MSARKRIKIDDSYPDALKEEHEENKKKLEESYKKKQFLYQYVNYELNRWLNEILSRIGIAGIDEIGYLLTIYDLSDENYVSENKAIENFKKKLSYQGYDNIKLRSHRIKVGMVSFVLFTLNIY
jgi:hypothetical protein